MYYIDRDSVKATVDKLLYKRPYLVKVDHFILGYYLPTHCNQSLYLQIKSYALLALY